MAPPWRRARPRSALRHRARASLAAIAGNTSSTTAQSKADLARLTEVAKISLGGNIHDAGSEVDGTGTTAANKVGAFGRYDWNLGPRRFAFGRLALDRDEPTDPSLRRAVGAGLGWKLVDTRPLRLSVCGGVGRTVGRYDSAQTIYGTMSLTFGVVDVYDGKPPAGLNTSDRSLFTGQARGFLNGATVAPDVGLTERRP